MAVRTNAAPARSLYVSMRDGVKLGIDLYLPEGIRRHRLPTIVHFTRYFRGISWSSPLEKLGLSALTDVTREPRQRFLAAGYAWVSVDARGSGASFGSRPCEWSSDEREDQREILDWIVTQPWSSGRVGAMGVSYSGTCSEFLRIDGHPGLCAVAPLYSLFDVYEDVACPGGVQLAWFTKTWGKANDALDRNALHEVIASALSSSYLGKSDFYADRGESLRAKVFAALGDDRVARATSLAMQRAVRGVRAIEGAATLARAVSEHQANYDVHASVENIVFRDDQAPSKALGELSIGAFSPHSYVHEMCSSKVPVLSVGGWHDSGYANAAIKRHAVLTDACESYLLLGPWDHGGTQDTSPFGQRTLPAYDHVAEYIRFFDTYLKGDGDAYRDTPRVRYFTMGRESWHAARRWPPPEAKSLLFHLRTGGKLSPSEEAGESSVPYSIDETLGSGVRSRWRSLIQLRAPVGYSDRSALAHRMLTFTTDSLVSPIEITGHVALHLWLRTAATDATVFAYLEDVWPNGRVEYVTEGMFRALHRAEGALPHTRELGDSGVNHTYLRGDAKPLEPGAFARISFALQPTSYLVGIGHALRISLAGCDVDNFAPVRGVAKSFEVRVGGENGSRLSVPALARQ
ncbi:MAG: CocE/NonD family hydrolase [Polyangiaceae bacterium]